MKKVIDSIKDFFKKLSKNEYFKAFCYIYLIGLVCFSIEAIGNHFTLPLSGDYTLQTYAFYSQGYHIFWNFIKTGEYPLFDFSNYLGANYLGTQSFYYVFSPLFYLLCLWPEKLLYQGIFFHMVFKFALGGFFMYILLRKYFHVSFKMSWIGGFIYAFSGWTLFYLWFHFGDAMAFFPLFIMGIEKCLKERKGWLLGLATFLCGISNYFFLVNFCIFGAMYAIYRWIYIYGINKKRGYSAKVRWGVLLQGIGYGLAGVLMAGICLFPSLHVAMSTNRTQTSSSYLLSLLETIFVSPERVDGKLILGESKNLKEILTSDNLKNLFKNLFVWNDRKISTMDVPAKVNIGYILSNWIYMNTNCWDNIMFDNASLDNAIGGFFITTPLTMLLIPSIIQALKSKRPWTIFGVLICLALPFFPITSHAAFAFTSLYGRWQIWIVLIGIIFIIPTLDKFETINRRWVTVNLFFNYLLAICVYFISKGAGKIPTGDTFNVFGKDIPGMLIVSFVEILVMLIVWAIYRFKFFKPAMVKKLMMGIIVMEIGASTVITIENKGYANWDTYYLAQPQYEELTDIVKEMQEEDTDFYRVMNTEATRSIMNLPSALNYNGASTFNSTYDFELDDFKNRSKMAYGGSWTMGNHEKRYWLDQYIGTKYYIIDKLDPNNDNDEYYRDRTVVYDGRTSMQEEQQDYRLNLGWNYDLYKSYDYYDVYKNNNFIGIGYCVDEYISSKSTSSSLATYYEELYATTAIIENEDMEKLAAFSEDLSMKTSYNVQYKTFSQSRWDLYFSPREDASSHLTNNRERQTYEIQKNSFTENEIKQYLPEGCGFLHRRWEENNYYGDQLILKLRNSNEPLAKLASDDNLCYINLSFKLGPKVLISFYNGDTLVTQDAHMNSNSSLNAENYEWKVQRGFYLNQPVDKIVIEFISDTYFNQVFSSGGSLRNIDITYAYQSEIENMQEKINSSLLTDVNYHQNTFTFKSNTDKKKIAVTNIPYDAGWTLKANGKVHDMFKVNGGFIGFITNEELTEYELSYFTPKLKTGLLSTGVGLLLYLILGFVYKNKKINILSCEEQIASIYMKQQEIQEEKYFKEHEKYVHSVIEKIKKKIKKER